MSLSDILKPKFERLLENDKAMFVTITLPPRMYSKKAKTQMDLFKPKCSELCKCLCDELLLVAELTNKANIHFHGMIVFREDMNFTTKCAIQFFYEFFKGYSRVDIQPIKHKNEMTLYCLKEVEPTAALLKAKPFYEYSREKQNKLYSFYKNIYGYNIYAEESTNFKEATTKEDSQSSTTSCCAFKDIPSTDDSIQRPVRWDEPGDTDSS